MFNVNDAREEKWREVRKAGPAIGTTMQRALFRVEHSNRSHPSLPYMNVGPYNHRAMWSLPTWGYQPGVDMDSGRHMPLHRDSDFRRLPKRTEFFGFGSMESCDRWFCPAFYPWLKKHDFVVREYEGQVEAGWSQAVLETGLTFKLVRTVLSYAYR